MGQHCLIYPLKGLMHPAPAAVYPGASLTFCSTPMPISLAKAHWPPNI